MYQNRIQTCCELPNDMLENENKKLNDYDFVLYHLFAGDWKYREYYLNIRKTCGRTIIFDNSAYEFFVKGEKLVIPKFMEAIQELKPHISLLPDVLMNKDETLKGVEECLSLNPLDYAPQGQDSCIFPKWMAVLQGNSKQDFIDCANKYMEMGIKNVAIPFHNTFLRDEMFHRGDPHTENEWRLKFGRINDDMRYALGRIQLIKEIWGFLVGFERVHFLGSHNPYEKKYIQDFLSGIHLFEDKVVSMDTGYPTKCGVAGDKLFHEIQKPTYILDDFVNDKFSPGDLSYELIKENVQIFHDL